MHPLGPVVDDVISALVNDGDYANENVRNWSKMVSACHGFIILTPQFNWGYPGDLKNAMDHLYKEWHGKPVLLVTYGGHGGGKCGSQLRQVLQGLHMKTVQEEVGICLPPEYIRSSERVAFDSSNPDGESSSCAFLQAYDESLQRGIHQFLTLLSTPEYEHN